jgi:hypothetical protein
VDALLHGCPLFVAAGSPCLHWVNFLCLHRVNRSRTG